MDPVTDGVVAAPPAAAEAPVAAPVARPALSALSETERLEWRKTGQLPAASSTATADAPPAATVATSDPDSAPAADDPDYKPKTARRIADLLAENKRLKALATPPPAPKPAAAPVAAAALVKPDPDKFTYGTADPGYLDALTDFKVAKAREDDRVSAAESAKKAQSDTDIALIRASWTEKEAASKAKHADFEQVAYAAFKPGFEIHIGSPTDVWITDAANEHGTEVLYYLQKNTAEIKRINALPVMSQVRALAEIERLALAASTVKTKTDAPEPGPVLGVRAGDPASDSVRALKKRDTRAYIDAKNREELAARKGH